MLGGKSDGRWLIPVAIIAAIAASTFLFATNASSFLSSSGGTPLFVRGALHGEGAQNDGAVEAAAQPAPTQEPSLYEILRAADLLARAGAIATPIPEPTPSLMETLKAADALAKAGALPPAEPTPSLMEILQAADALARAGALPAPPQPSLMEILQAADALARAGKLPGQQLAPPPPSAPLPPQATPTPPPPPAQPAPHTVAGWYDDGYIAEIWDLINRQRTNNGLAPVQHEARLAQAAADYARILSDDNWFSHVGPDGSTLVTRIEAAGFPFNVQIGEILAWGTAGWTAAAVVQAWMDSPTHREEILSPVYTRAGASCYFIPANAVTVHCVVDFAG